MVKCLAAFLDFCYLVRHNSICTDTLDRISDALNHFHHYRKVFIETNVRIDNISLPQQHSLIHYLNSIILFGSPNGLCSSIMELKHIKAVKKPWHHSSCYHALLQMLVINEWQDKLMAMWSVFTQKGMLQGTTLAYTTMMLCGDRPPPLPVIQEEGRDDHGAVTGPWVMNMVTLAVTAGELDTALNIMSMSKSFSQNVIILNIFLSSHPILISPSSLRWYGNSSLTSWTWTSTWTQWLCHSVTVHNSMVEFLYTTQSLQGSMLQAIFVMLEACAMSTSVPLHCGCWNGISGDVIPTWNRTFRLGIVSDHCAVKTCANDIILTADW